MMSKFSTVAAIVAISFLGLNLPAANAQPAPPELPFGDGDYLDPWINCRVWVGYDMLDKDASGLTDENGEPVADSDTYLGYTGGGTELGFTLKKGKLSASASLSTSFNNEDSDTGKALGVSAKYQVNDDLLFHYGNGADPHMPYKGDQPWAASPADDGFRGFGVGGGQTMIDVAYKGAYLGFFRKGYSPMSAFDNSSSNSTIDYTLPRTVVGYQYSGPLSIGVAGLYQTKKIDKPIDDMGTPTDPTDDVAYALDGTSIVSYAVSCNLGFMSGPIHAAAHGFYTQNGSDMAFFPPGISAETDAADPTKMLDRTAMGGNFVLAYNMGTFEPCAGVAYKVVEKNDNYLKDDPSMAYFFRVKFIIAPEFNIQPGIIITDNMKGANDQKEGTKTQFGVFLETTI